MPNILLGVSGSVAAIKARELVAALSQIGDVQVVVTGAADRFLKRLVELDGHELPCRVWRDSDEWPPDYKLFDPIPHIALRRWASCLVLAPLSANTLAKIHYGLCDNLLTCIYRAWDWSRPIVIAPAMNTFMWENHPTDEQIKAVVRRGVRLAEPVEKRLACDDVGMGALAPIDTILKLAQESLRWGFPLAHCNGIPINHHPGAFGFQRRKNHHTGVDLYTNDDEPVYAVEPGEIVKIDHFTGPLAGHDWWEDTWGIMIEGPSGVVNYGEVRPNGAAIYVGRKVGRGHPIAYVKRVLFQDKLRPDIPGHSTSMLHLELYKHGAREFADWHDATKNPDLLDPTPYLMAATGAVPTLTWDNQEAKPVG